MINILLDWSQLSAITDLSGKGTGGSPTKGCCSLAGPLLHAASTHSQGVFLPPYNQLQFLLHWTSLAWSPPLLPYGHLKAPQPNPTATCLLQPFLHTLTLSIGWHQEVPQHLPYPAQQPCPPSRAICQPAELALHPISQVTHREAACKLTAEYHTAESDVYRTLLSCLIRLNEEQLLRKCDFSTHSLLEWQPSFHSDAMWLQW